MAYVMLTWRLTGQSRTTTAYLLWRCGCLWEAEAHLRAIDSRGARHQRVYARGYSWLRRSKDGDGEFRASVKGEYKGSPVFCERQQRLRLAIHQLVLLALHRWKLIWPFEHQPRLAIQGNGQRHVPEFQAPAENHPYP